MMISNGYKLTRDVAVKLKAARVTRVQITLDGDGATHDSRRHLTSGRGTFAKILENVQAIAAERLLHISVRVNIDGENEACARALLDALQGAGLGVRNGVSVYFAPVESVAEAAQGGCDRCLSKTEYAEAETRLQALAVEVGLIAATKVPRFLGLCTAVTPNSYLVVPNGDQHMFWDTVMDAGRRVGAVIGHDRKADARTKALWSDWSPFDNPVCGDCTLLPSCGGACAFKFVHNDHASGEAGKLPCPSLKLNMAEQLFLRAKARGFVQSDDWDPRRSPTVQEDGMLTGQRHTLGSIGAIHESLQGLAQGRALPPVDIGGSHGPHPGSVLFRAGFAISNGNCQSCCASNGLCPFHVTSALRAFLRVGRPMRMSNARRAGAAGPPGPVASRLGPDRGGPVGFFRNRISRLPALGPVPRPLRRLFARPACRRDAPFDTFALGSRPGSAIPPIPPGQVSGSGLSVPGESYGPLAQCAYRTNRLSIADRLPECCGAATSGSVGGTVHGTCQVPGKVRVSMSDQTAELSPPSAADAPGGIPVGAVLFALAMGGFAIGTTEFAAMALVPNFAADLGVSEARAADAISAYALGVVVGAPLLAVAGARMRKRRLLIWLMLAFAVFNTLSAMAPTFGTFVLSRFFSGLPHGAYFGVAALVAASVVPRNRRASAVARIFLGLTIATTIGVPAASWVSQFIGWRAGFVIVGGLALATALAVALKAPRTPADPNANPLRELGALKNRQVWLTLLTGAIGFGGFFAVYTYIASTVITTLGKTHDEVALMLMVAGVGMTVFNLLMGAAADRNLNLTAYVAFGGGAVVLLLFPTAVGLGLWPMALAVFCMSVLGGVSTVMQTRLMNVAGDAQQLAASLHHAAFNVANALGPFLAARFVASGHGFEVSGYVGAGLSAAGFVLFAITLWDARRSGYE